MGDACAYAVECCRRALRGEVEVLANQGLARVDPSKEFDDIFVIIAELAATVGSVKMHGLDVEATV